MDIDFRKERDLIKGAVNMSKQLILFYSFEGSTKMIAEYLSQKLNIPCEGVKPMKDLKSKGFSKYPLGGKQVIFKNKPELLSIKANLEEYDTIFIGSPIWAGSFTPAIRSLLETGILKDKKIALFYTSLGGPGKAESKIKESVEINNKFLSSYGLVNVKDDFDTLKNGVLDWAKNIEKK